jgi:putative DNA primase/helicase
MTAAEIAGKLADRIQSLTAELLPNGRRDGREWRVGSVMGEAGSSLAVCLAGTKAGVWHDFATGESGDALDLVCSVLDIGMPAALTWSRCWLGLEDGTAELPRRSTPKPELEPDPDRWRIPWRSARPIAGSLAEIYLRSRGLRFDDPVGRVLRFAAQRARKSPEGEFERHPALLCALSDTSTGEQCGIINIYLQPDGSDRVRDKKGKTVTGRPSGAVVTLSDFDEPVSGLILCEGVETGIALFQQELRPIWACGSASTLAKFPVLGGIEALTVAADADAPGQRAANELAERWRHAGREVRIVPPEAGDWADQL